MNKQVGARGSASGCAPQRGLPAALVPPHGDAARTRASSHAHSRRTGAADEAL